MSRVRKTRLTVQPDVTRRAQLQWVDLPVNPSKRSFKRSPHQAYKIAGRMVRSDNGQFPTVAALHNSASLAWAEAQKTGELTHYLALLRARQGQWRSKKMASNEAILNADTHQERVAAQKHVKIFEALESLCAQEVSQVNSVLSQRPSAAKGVQRKRKGR